MENELLTIERTYLAPISAVWKAITDKDEMKSWYFDLPEFKPEVGCVFQFWGGPAEDRQYKHICCITEVVPIKRISYSWQYEGYPGNTLVSFDLRETNGETTVKLTHEGLESFPADVPDLAKVNFVQGWTWIIGTSLKNYLENKVKP